MQRAIQSSKIASLVYNAMLRLLWLEKYSFGRQLWQRAWRKSCRTFSSPVRTRLHDRTVILNFGHTYPIYTRKYTTLNDPLVELVFQTYTVQSSPITIVDVGANIGDTILLLESKCPGMLEAFYCFDAEEEFTTYLKTNLAHLNHGHIIHALLSSTTATERALVRTQAASASAQGQTRVPCTTLDSIHLNQVDVLKIDVDGLDGRVLQGAQRTLAKHQPAVVFEWHPTLCNETGNDWRNHFSVLEQSGYTTCIWFTKYGTFNHFSTCSEKESIALLAALCLETRVYGDWHYDVIALPHNSRLSHISLAELKYARSRQSKH